jgi:hypothetical protein
MLREAECQPLRRRQPHDDQIAGVHEPCCWNGIAPVP